MFLNFIFKAKAVDRVISCTSRGLKGIVGVGAKIAGVWLSIRSIRGNFNDLMHEVIYF